MKHPHMCFSILVKVLDNLCAHERGFGKYRIGDDSWEIIEHLIYFLHPFAELTNLMSGQKYSTISGVIVLFNAIMDHLEMYSEGIAETTNPPPVSLTDAAYEAFEKVKEYYNKTSHIHCIVTLLDPRCNLKYFEDNGFQKDMIDPFLDR